MARFHLRITEKEFWRLQVRQLIALLHELEEARRIDDWHWGQLTALIANVNRDPKKRRKAFEPADFYPSLLPPGKRDPGKEMHLRSMAHGLAQTGNWGRVTTRAEREAEEAAKAAEASLTKQGIP